MYNIKYKSCTYYLLIDQVSNEPCWRQAYSLLEAKNRCIYQFLQWEMCWWLVQLPLQCVPKKWTCKLTYLQEAVQNVYLSLMWSDLTKWWRALLDALKSLLVWGNNMRWHCWASPSMISFIVKKKKSQQGRTQMCLVTSISF